MENEKTRVSSRPAPVPPSMPMTTPVVKQPVEPPVVVRTELPKPIMEKKPEKKEVDRKELKPRKKRKLLPLVLLLIAAAVVYVVVFSGGSGDSETPDPASCQHDWELTDCEAPRVCTRCGVKEEKAPGHQWQKESTRNICAVCGATEYISGETILKQVDTTFAVELFFDADAKALSIRVPEDKDFAVDTISILDYTGAKVNAERFTVSRDSDTVTISLPDDFAPGKYTICSGFQEHSVVEIYYGSIYEALPVEQDIWPSYFTVQDGFGEYLTKVDETLVTAEQGIRFQNPWQICRVVETADGATVDTTGLPDQFRCDSYWVFDVDGQETECVTFEYDGWFLAWDYDDHVYLTKELGEGCFWILSK